MDQAPQAPSVFEYLDVVLYLQAYYSYRKTLNKKFSYKIWSDELNFNSRSFLRLILAGKKRLSPKLAESIALKNFNNPEHADYFRYLVGYSRSLSSTEKEIFGQRMIKLIRDHETSPAATGDLSILITDSAEGQDQDLQLLDTLRYPERDILFSRESLLKLRTLLQELPTAPRLDTPSAEPHKLFQLVLNFYKNRGAPGATG